MIVLFLLSWPPSYRAWLQAVLAAKKIPTHTHTYALTHREADSPTESIGFAMLRWPAEAIYRIALEESCFCTLLVQTVEGSVLMWSFENFNCMVGTE